MTEEEVFFHKVRLLQRKTKCSNTVCDEFVSIFKKANKGKITGRLENFDRKAKRAAGVQYLVLHGCPKCKKYVYGPKDRNLNCPFIKEDGTVCGHTRYNDGKPWEVSLFVIYAHVCMLS